MPRLTELNQMLFPVEERPVFVSVRDGTGERKRAVREKKAIVNRVTGHVLGIVSRGYRLVSNQQALDWAHQCCRTVFPDTQPGEWHVEVADAPATGGHCFIDLVHNSTGLDFHFLPAQDRPEAFGPFIRVVNSYNGLRALAFVVGYYRKVCRNGLIIPQAIIRFSFTHLRREIGQEVRFNVAHERLAGFHAAFGNFLGALHKCVVARKLFEPLMCAVLQVSRPDDLEPDSVEAEQWDALAAHVRDLCDRYARELGENAYGVFNAITDFSSHPPTTRISTRERHSMQLLAGTWLGRFAQECQQPDFKIDSHLAALVAKDPEPGQCAI